MNPLQTAIKTVQMIFWKQQQEEQHNKKASMLTEYHNMLQLSHKIKRESLINGYEHGHKAKAMEF